MKNKMRKIYNEITLAWNEITQRYDEVLYEDSFMYGGEVAEAMPCVNNPGLYNCSTYQAGESCSYNAPFYCHTFYDNCEHDEVNWGTTCSWYNVNNCPEDYGCTWEEVIPPQDPDITISSVESENTFTMDASQTYDEETSQFCQWQIDDWDSTDDCLRLIWTYDSCEGTCNPTNELPYIPYSTGEEFGHGQTVISNITAPFVRRNETDTYVFKLTVTDPGGLSDQETIRISVTGINHAPSVDITVTTPTEEATYTNPGIGTDPPILYAKSGDIVYFSAELTDIDGTSDYWGNATPNDGLVFWLNQNGEGNNFSFDNQSLSTNATMLYINPAGEYADGVTNEIYFSARDGVQLLQYSDNLSADGYIKLNVSADQMPTIVEWNTEGMSPVTPASVTTWNLIAHDEEDCPNGTDGSGGWCLDCVSGNQNCLNYENFQITQGNEYIDDYTWFPDGGNSEPKLNNLTIKEWHADWHIGTDNPVYCANIAANVEVQDNYNPTEEIDQTIASLDIQTYCPPVFADYNWTELSEDFFNHWKINMQEDIPINTEIFEFFASDIENITYTWTYDTDQIQSVVVNNVIPKGGNRYALDITITPAPEFWTSAGITLELVDSAAPNNAPEDTPLWSLHPARRTLMCDIAAVCDGDFSPQLNTPGIGAKTWIDNVEQSWLWINDYGDASFTMDQRSSGEKTGEFMFYVYDIDDHYAENIWMDIEIKDGVTWKDKDGTQLSAATHSWKDPRDGYVKNECSPSTSYGDNDVYECVFKATFDETTPAPNTIVVSNIVVYDYAWHGCSPNNPVNVPNDEVDFNLSISVFDINDPPQINVSVTVS